MKTKSDWYVWRAYFRATGKTLALAVGPRGQTAHSSFRNLPVGKQVDFERRATIHNCTKEEAESVMRVLNPDVLGMPN